MNKPQPSAAFYGIEQRALAWGQIVFRWSARAGATRRGHRQPTRQCPRASRAARAADHTAAPRHPRAQLRCSHRPGQHLVPPVRAARLRHARYSRIAPRDLAETRGRFRRIGSAVRHGRRHALARVASRGRDRGQSRRPCGPRRFFRRILRSKARGNRAGGQNVRFVCPHLRPRWSRGLDSRNLARKHHSMRIESDSGELTPAPNGGCNESSHRRDEVSTLRMKKRAFVPHPDPSSASTTCRTSDAIYYGPGIYGTRQPPRPILEREMQTPLLTINL